MTKITLYHGSTNIIVHPSYGLGKSYNDYGRGFYCTEHLELAKEWACNDGVDGFANQYELDLSGLDILNLSDNKYSILNWLAILMDNRIVRMSTPIEKHGRDYLLEHFLPEYKKSDVIVGYRADDSYFSFARSFMANTISLEQLKYAMHLGKLGEQYVLKSEKAFGHIRFVAGSFADSKQFYPKKKTRDEHAREAFIHELEKNDISGIYMRDIIQNKMEANDERLQ